VNAQDTAFYTLTHTHSLSLTLSHNLTPTPYPISTSTFTTILTRTHAPFIQNELCSFEWREEDRAIDIPHTYINLKHRDIVSHTQPLTHTHTQLLTHTHTAVEIAHTYTNAKDRDIVSQTQSST